MYLLKTSRQSRKQLYQKPYHYEYKDKAQNLNCRIAYGRCCIVRKLIQTQKLIERVLTYFFMFFLCLFLSMLVLSLADLSVQQTMDMSLACLTSTGPMMMFHMEPWQVRQLPDWIKLYCGLLMVVGKVNIFTFVLLVHGVWAKAGKKRW